MTSSSTRKQKLVTLVLAAMFLAIGIVLPFFTGQIPQIGSMLLPMHIPVLLCGLICGWRYGALVGFVLPLVRSLWLGMPPFSPPLPWPLSWRPTAASWGRCMPAPAGNAL